MLKLMILIRRIQGITPEQFYEYYENRHIPLVLRLLPYSTEYRRNFIRHGLSYNPGTGAQSAIPDFDVITELTFENRAGHDRMIKAMSDPLIRKQILESEERFMDRNASVVFFVDEAVTPRNKLKEKT